MIRNTGISIGDTIDKLDSQVSDIYGMNELAEPWYSDQILPFDVTLAGANEYGAMAAAKILGIEILNEGSGVSIDDAVTEMQATFVARTIEPMQTRSLRPRAQPSSRAHARGRRPALPTLVGVTFGRSQPEFLQQAVCDFPSRSVGTLSAGKKRGVVPGWVDGEY